MILREEPDVYDRIESLLRKFSFYDESLEPVEEKKAVNLVIRH